MSKSHASASWLHSNRTVLVVSLVLLLLLAAFTYGYLFLIDRKQAPGNAQPDLLSPKQTQNAIFVQEQRVFNLGDDEAGEAHGNERNVTGESIPSIQGNVMRYADEVQVESRQSLATDTQQKREEVRVLINQLALDSLQLVREQRLVQKKSNDIEVLQELWQMSHESYYSQLQKKAKLALADRKKKLQHMKQDYTHLLYKLCVMPGIHKDNASSIVLSQVPGELNASAVTLLLHHLDVCLRTHPSMANFQKQLDRELPILARKK